eukprot:s2161_g8.t1
MSMNVDINPKVASGDGMVSIAWNPRPGRPVGRVRFSLPAAGERGKAPAAALPTRRPREALGGHQTARNLMDVME